MADLGLTAEERRAVALATAIRDAERRDKDAAADKIAIPRFKHNPDRIDTTVRPWPGAPYALPRDVVELFKRGHQPPLIWLTVEGILDAGRRRQQLTFPLDKKGLDEVNEALARDAFLPRAPFLSAMGALAALFRAFQVVEEVAEEEQDSATLIDELSLAVAARAPEEHWTLWRKYVCTVLNSIWDPQRGGELDFNVGKIDADTLRLTEEAASVPQGRADDHSNDSTNLITYLLTSRRSDAEAAAQRYEKGLKTFARTLPATLIPFEPRQHQGPLLVMAERLRGSLLPAHQPAAAASAEQGNGAPPACSQTPDTTSASVQKRTQSASGSFLPTAGDGMENHSVFAIDTTSASIASRRSTNAPLVTTARLVEGTDAAQSPVPVPEEDAAIMQAFRQPSGSLLQAQVFSQAIQSLPPSHRARFVHIPGSITAGFSMGPLSMPATSIIAPNHFRPDQAAIISAWRDEALAKQFAAGPFTIADIERVEGPVVTIPLTVVHTPAVLPKPEKNRVCFNATWDPGEGQSTGSVPSVSGSINHELRDEDVKCEWFLINEVKLILASLPPWARVMGFDLADAYQQLANAAEQRRRMVFAVEDSIYVWLRGMFGVCTMAAIFGQLCDVTCAWMERKWETVLARHFADDHLIADTDPTHLLTEQDVLSEVERFGWRIHATKRFAWARRFEL
ncbi:hypothetical protein A4X13_0g8850, partial [Tilletia indica]